MGTCYKKKGARRGERESKERGKSLSIQNDRKLMRHVKKKKRADFSPASMQDVDEGSVEGAITLDNVGSVGPVPRRTVRSLGDSR